MQRRFAEITVGLFMLAGILALIALAFKVSGLTQLHEENFYTVTADFDNIGSLKVRAPIRIAGVRVGQVKSIELDKETFRAHVNFLLNKRENNIPVDSSAKILTEGILGANYVGLTPGFESNYLHDGDALTTTHPALILENMLGQLLFSLKDKK